jgi:hypothetical protein
MAVTASAFAAFATIQHAPVVAVGLTATVLLPALMLWLSRRNDPTPFAPGWLTLWSLAMMCATWGGATIALDAAFGSTHSNSAAVLFPPQHVEWAWMGGLGPESINVTARIVAGCCARAGSTRAVFDAIAAEDPLLYLNLGDAHHSNIADGQVGRFHAAYNRLLTQPGQAALYSDVPVSYVWDGHDYGPNNADGTPPSRDAAREAFRLNMPSHQLESPNGAIRKAYTIGRVRFIVTDTRSERLNNTTATQTVLNETMLGADQLAWFVDELVAASRSHGLVIWMNPTPSIGAAAAGVDGWGGFSDERRQIADVIASEGIDNLLMVSCDAHMLAFDDGSNSGYASDGAGGFPVFHAAAHDRDIPRWRPERGSRHRRQRPEDRRVTLRQKLARRHPDLRTVDVPRLNIDDPHDHHTRSHSPICPNIGYSKRQCHTEEMGSTRTGRLSSKYAVHAHAVRRKDFGGPLADIRRWFWSNADDSDDDASMGERPMVKVPFTFRQLADEDASHAFDTAGYSTVEARELETHRRFYESGRRPYYSGVLDDGPAAGTVVYLGFGFDGSTQRDEVLNFFKERFLPLKHDEMLVEGA